MAKTHCNLFNLELLQKGLIPSEKEFHPSPNKDSLTDCGWAPDSPFCESNLPFWASTYK